MNSNIRHKFIQPVPATGIFISAALTGITFTTLYIPAKAIDNRIDKSIVVRIEGATQGSGVVIQKDGSNYTILTSWHVISPNNDGEEIEVFSKNMPAGKILTKKGISGNVIRVPGIDMGLLRFKSTRPLPVAKIAKDPTEKDVVTVIGYPISTNGLQKSYTGTLLANADVGIDQGYQLLYNAYSEAGMSGGALLNDRGELVGIHGRGEKNIAAKQTKFGKGYKTGVNQGVPMSLYKEYKKTGTIKPRNNNPKSFSDYYALAINANRSGHPQTALRLSKMMQKLKPSQAKSYAVEAFVLDDLGMGDTPKRAAAMEKFNELFSVYYDKIKEAWKIKTSEPRKALALASIAEQMMNEFYIDIDLIKSFAYDADDKPARVVFHTNRVIDLISGTPKGKRVTLLMENTSEMKEFNLSAMYFMNASARDKISDYEGSKNAYSSAIAYHPDKASASYKIIYFLRANAELNTSSPSIFDACRDFDMAYSDPKVRKNFPNLGQRYRDTICDGYPKANDLHFSLARKLCQIPGEPPPAEVAESLVAEPLAKHAKIPSKVANNIGGMVVARAMMICPGKFS